MVNNESGFNASSSQDGCANSSADYLRRAALAVESGDNILGIHLYLAAYERALCENMVPSAEALEGMSKAWDLAVSTKQRSLAEYIFEKLEPFWDTEEVARHADQLQQLAFDKLEEYGFDRDAIEDMADMVNQDILDGAADVLCQFQEHQGEEQKPAKPSEADNLEAMKRMLSEALAGSEGAEAPQPSPAASAPNVSGMAMLPKAPAASHTAASHTPPSAPSKNVAPAAPEQQRFDYRSLVGFDNAIATMSAFGVGRSRDPEFAHFVEMLNRRHGLPGIPGLGTLVFRCPAREDANYFMVATVGELGMPAVRMRLDRNAQGQVVLCVMASADFKSRLSGLARSGFESPTAVILEDLDLWDLPDFDATPEDWPGIIQMQLSRGAREALALIQTALESPEVTVFVSASEPEQIDPYFQDLLGSYRMIDIELPDTEERRGVWRSVQAQHPSMRGLDVAQLVDFSRTLSRFEIFALANEAVEDAYRESLAKQSFQAVRTSDILTRLANFQPLESAEYQRMEDLAVKQFREATSDFDDLLEG